MRRRIIWILVGALFLLGAMGLLWWWFLLRAPEAPTDTGGFGASDTRPSTVTPSQPTGTNIGTPIPPGSTLIGGTQDTSGTGGGAGGSGSVGVSVPADTGSTLVPGVSWLGGGNIFSPTPINPVDSGSVSGSLPAFGGSGTAGGPGGSGSGLDGALIGLGVGAVSCIAFIAPGPGSAPSFPPAVYVKDSANDNKNFLDCMTRVLAKVALQQMTASIVNWINSGFEGKPSFVTNYEQFFSNVADQAAGEFIRGSSLSFLCSPFQPQVRIAIAQSYARRSSAPSCSLAQVTGNIDNFIKGNFSQGGWPAFISFTTTPTNNPYGAYMYGQSALNQAVTASVDRGRLDITIGRGFLSFKDQNGNVQTPGSFIEQMGVTTFGTSFRQLELAKNFDEIVGALIQQLITRTLYGGLSNLSVGSGGYENNFLSGTDIQAQQAGQALLTALQGSVSLAQQYGYTKQGAIGDIQNAQQQLQNLANCRLGRNDSAGEQQALAKISELESRVTILNNDIIRANASIAALQQFQTRVFSATTAAQIQAIQAEVSAAQAAGTLVSQGNVTQAQQDRSALQSEMATLNQQTATQIDQCYAGGA